MEDAVEWMENVCAGFSTNPKEASEALMQFRNSDRAIDASQYIIEHSAMALAQFHGACCLQAAALRQWEAFELANRTQLRNFVWTMCLTRGSSLERPVMNQLLQSLALFWKRSWQHESGAEKQALFSGLSGLANGPDENNLFLVSKALNALVEEFSATKSAAVGLPLEFHKQAHNSFQDEGLTSVLGLAMMLLGRVLNGLKQENSQVNSELLASVLSLCVAVLSWEFGGDCWDPWRAPAAHQFVTPTKKLAGDWRQHLVQPEFLLAVFDVYERLVATSGAITIGHLGRQLLIQLCSVRGSIFEDNNQKSAYAGLMLQGCAGLLTRRLGVAVNDPDEALEFCSMVGRLIGNFGVGLLASLPQFHHLLSDMSRAAQKLLTNVIQSAQAGSEIEEIWQMEAFDILLETWVVVIEDPYTRKCLEGFQTENNYVRTLVELGLPIYEQYIVTRTSLSHLEAKQYCNVETEEDEEEIERANLDEQLAAAACIGRLAAPYAATVLSRQLAGENGCLVKLQALVQDPAVKMAGASHLGLASVLEECYVLTLCAGHLLADASEGEEPLIPELIVLCMDPRRPGGAVDLSPLLALVDVLKDLLAFQVRLLAQSSPEDPCLSPHLNQALLWFFARFIRPYYGQQSPVFEPSLLPTGHMNGTPQGQGVDELTARYGAGDAAVADLTQLLEACWAYLVHWPTESEVSGSAVDLLQTVLSPGGPGYLVAGQPAHALLLEEYCADLMRQERAGSLRLPSDLRCNLVQALTKSASSLAKGDDQAGALSLAGQQLLQRLVEPVERRLNVLVSGLQQPNQPGAKHHHRSQHPAAVSNAELCLDLYTGIARATDSKNQEIIAVVCLKMISIAPQLADTFLEHQSVVLGILEFLRDFAEVQIPILSKSRANQLYDACGRVLKVYAEHHIGETTVDPTVEEDNFVDIMCVLQLLTNLVTKDLVDYSEEEESPETHQVAVSDVIFFGLGKILPLMTENLLQFPSLCSHYFALVSFMLETYADKLQELDNELFLQLIVSIVYGIKHADAAVSRHSLQAINELATYHAKAVLKGDRGLGVHKDIKQDLFLEPLQVLLEMVAFQSGVWDRIDTCANAMFALIVCERNGFENLVGSILHNQPDETIRARLGTSFQSLVTSNQIVFDLTRINRNRFKDNMKRFVSSVRSFMHTH